MCSHFRRDHGIKILLAHKLLSFPLNFHVIQKQRQNGVMHEKRHYTQRHGSTYQHAGIVLYFAHLSLLPGQLRLLEFAQHTLGFQSLHSPQTSKLARNRWWANKEKVTTIQSKH